MRNGKRVIVKNRKGGRNRGGQTVSDRLTQELARRKVEAELERIALVKKAHLNPNFKKFLSTHEQAETLAQTGQYAEALKLYLKAEIYFKKIPPQQVKALQIDMDVEASLNYNTGMCYYQINELDKAIAYVTRAAHANFTLGISLLAHIYLGMKKYNSAKEWYFKALKLKDADAAQRLSEMAFNGWGMSKSEAMGIKFLEKAFEFGDDKAYLKIAVHYMWDDEPSKKQLKKAFEAHMTALEKKRISDNLEVCILHHEEIANIYTFPQFEYYNLQQSINYFTECYELGAKHFAFRVGSIYDFDGKTAEAIKWYKITIKLPDNEYTSDAYHNLGIIYSSGEVNPDYELAKQYFIEGYKRDNIKSGMQLGDLYVERFDDEEACESLYREMMLKFDNPCIHCNFALHVFL